MVMDNKYDPRRTSELEFCEKVKAENKNKISVVQGQYIRLMPAFYPRIASKNNENFVTIHFGVE